VLFRSAWMTSALVDYSRQNTIFLRINRQLPSKSPSCKIVRNVCKDNEQSLKSISLHNIASSANNFILVRPWRTLSISLMNIIKRMWHTADNFGNRWKTVLNSNTGICFQQTMKSNEVACHWYRSFQAY